MNNQINQIKDYFNQASSKNASPDQKSSLISLIGTAVFWLIMFIILGVAKPFKSSPKYKTVQIVLSSEPEIKKTEKKMESAASAPAPLPAEPQVKESVSKPVEKPVADKKVETVPEKKNASPAIKTESKSTPVKAEPVKPAQSAQKSSASNNQQKTQTAGQKAASPTVKQTPAPVKEEPVKLAKNVDDMLDFSSNRQVVKKEVDWDSMFADDIPSKNDSSSVSDNSVVTSSSSMSGSAASAATVSNTGAVSTAVSSKTEQKVTGETSDLLGRVSNAKYIVQSSSSVTSESIVKTKNSNGKTYVQMVSGATRALLDPKEPIIKISEEASKDIDATKNLSIRFEVSAKGNVLPSSVKITPESIITQKVRNEIIMQISSWIFEPDDSSATASFDYKIVKR